MSPYQFLEHYYNTNEIVYDWTADIYRLFKNNELSVGITPTLSPQHNNFSKYQKKQSIQRTLPYYSEEILDTFTKFYPIEWLNDGITTKAMDLYNIRYSIP
jgi:hypothetical protein